MSEVEPAINPYERYVKVPIPWVNGDVVSLPDLTEFRRLEDRFIDHIPHTESHVAVWEGRKDIDGILRPKRFFGRIAQIELVFTDAPKEFITHNGIRLDNNRTDQSLSDASEDMQANMFGFDFFAGLFSSGRGRVGTLKSFIAYAPPVTYRLGVLGKSAGAIRRVVGKPSVITDTPLDELREESINTALRLQRLAVLNPYRGAIETNRKT